MRTPLESNEMVAKQSDPFLWLAPDLACGEESYQEYAQRLMARLKRYFAGAGCYAADDLAAETLLRLTKKLTSGGPECLDGESRSKFLFGIAKNVLAEWRRGPGARETGLPHDPSGPFVLPPMDLMGRQCLDLLKDTVNHALAKLSEEDRKLILATVLNGECRQTLAELARERGIQEPAMRQRSRRTRLRFEAMLLASERIDDLIRCLGLKRGLA